MAERGLSDEVKSALLKEYKAMDNRLNSQDIWLKYEILATEFEQHSDVQNQDATKISESETQGTGII